MPKLDKLNHGDHYAGLDSTGRRPEAPRSSGPRRVFRYASDRVPISIISAYFVLDVGVYFIATEKVFVVGWLIAGIIPKACVCAWNHHHQHVPTFYSAPLNRLLEFMYGIQTGLVSDAWTLHHVLGHHRHYLDQELDESRWKNRSGRKMGEFEYAFSVSLTAYSRALRVGREYRRHRRIMIAALGGTVATLSAAVAYKPFNGLLVFVVPMILSLWITAWSTYAHHAGLETEDPFHASNNILHDWYNVMTGNLGYHTAHHYRCAVHWSELPALHETIRHRIPDHCCQQPGIPFCWLDGRATGPSRHEPPARQAGKAVSGSSELRLLFHRHRLLQKSPDRAGSSTNQSVDCP